MYDDIIIIIIIIADDIVSDVTENTFFVVVVSAAICRIMQNKWLNKWKKKYVQIQTFAPSCKQLKDCSIVTLSKNITWQYSTGSFLADDLNEVKMHNNDQSDELQLHDSTPWDAVEKGVHQIWIHINATVITLNMLKYTNKVHVVVLFDDILNMLLLWFYDW